MLFRCQAPKKQGQQHALAGNEMCINADQGRKITDEAGVGSYQLAALCEWRD